MFSWYSFQIIIIIIVINWQITVTTATTASGPCHLITAFLYVPLSLHEHCLLHAYVRLPSLTQNDTRCESA
jgi:hypothetical protein